jgi:hypothetical protein
MMGPALASLLATAARSSRSCLRERAGGGALRTEAGGSEEVEEVEVAGVGGGGGFDDDDVDGDSALSAFPDRRLKIPAHVRAGIGLRDLARLGFRKSSLARGRGEACRGASIGMEKKATLAFLRRFFEFEATFEIFKKKKKLLP